MFCNNCGNQIPEGAKFCNVCGNSVTQEGNEKPVFNAEKKPDFFSDVRTNPKKRWGLIGVAAAVVVVVITLICSSVGNVNSSPEKVAKAYFTSMANQDVENVLKTVPPYQLRSILRRSSSYTNEELEAMSRSRLEKEAFTVSKENLYNSEKVKILDFSCAVDPYSEGELDEYREAVRDGDYDFTFAEKMSVKDYAVVRASMKLVEDDEVETEEVMVICIKLDQNWYVLDVD